MLCFPFYSNVIFFRAEIPRTVLNDSSESGHPCLVSDLRRKQLCLSSRSVMLTKVSRRCPFPFWRSLHSPVSLELLLWMAPGAGTLPRNSEMQARFSVSPLSPEPSLALEEFHSWPIKRIILSSDWLEGPAFSPRGEGSLQKEAVNLS